MLAFLSRYISNFSRRCEPLRRITKSNQKFVWTQEQQTAFEDLKKAIITAPVLIPFRPERDTRSCDLRRKSDRIGRRSISEDREGVPTSSLRKSNTSRRREEILADRTGIFSSRVYHQLIAYVFTRSEAFRTCN